MDLLNSKIKSTNEEVRFETQNVGLYGWDETIDQYRQLKCDDQGVLSVSTINGGGGEATAALQSAQLTQETLTALNTNTGNIIATDTNIELNTLNTTSTLIATRLQRLYDGTQETRVMGIDDLGNQHQARTTTDGFLETINRSVRTTPINQSITITKVSVWGYSNTITMNAFRNLVVWGRINSPQGVGADNAIWIEASATGNAGTWYMSSAKILGEYHSTSPFPDIDFYGSHTNTAPYIRLARKNTRSDNLDEVWDLNWCLS